MNLENVRNVKILNSKKQDLAVAIHVPAITTDKLAILCPGYLDTKDYPHINLLAEQLVKEGYLVARFDPSGTWQSGGEISDYLTSQYLEDIKSLIEYMLKQSIYTHILLGGHSRGGQVSLLYAARDPRVTEVLAIMPSHGPVEGALRDEWEKNLSRNSFRDIPGSKQRKEFSVPFAHVLDRDRFDVLTDVKRIKSPIIFVAGQLDDIVTPEDVKEIYDSANEPKMYALVEGVGHNYRFNLEEIKRVNNIALEALRKLV